MGAPAAFEHTIYYLPVSLHALQEKPPINSDLSQPFPMQSLSGVNMGNVSPSGCRGVAALSL